MNLSKNNNGCIDLKNGYLTISVASSRKNISQKQDKIQKIGSGNQVVTLSYKSWDFGPIYARYGSDGCGVSSFSIIKNYHLRSKGKKFQQWLKWQFDPNSKAILRSDVLILYFVYLSKNFPDKLVKKKSSTTLVNQK